MLIIGLLFFKFFDLAVDFVRGLGHCPRVSAQNSAKKRQHEYKAHDLVAGLDPLFYFPYWKEVYLDHTRLVTVHGHLTKGLMPYGRAIELLCWLP